MHLHFTSPVVFSSCGGLSKSGLVSGDRRGSSTLGCTPPAWCGLPPKDAEEGCYSAWRTLPKDAEKGCCSARCEYPPEIGTDDGPPAWYGLVPGV